MVMPEQLVPFLLAAILITLSPGPDNLMVLSLGIARGRRHGVAFGLGCAFGCLSHTALASLGIAALVAASPLAFGLLKLGGGAYLLWLGVQALRHGGMVGPGVQTARALSPSRYFAQGLLANAINPKVAIFFLSFLPQFVRVEAGPAAVQTALLGFAFTLQAAVIFAALGAFAGSIGQWLGRHAAAGRWLDRLAGVVFIGLGARLALSR